MRGFNQVTIAGNLTRDPEIRQTPSGQTVANFSLALNRSYKQNDEWVEVTDFIDVVAWAKLAETVEKYLFRGSKALVSGRLQSRQWEQDGVKRTKVEVVANEVHFLDSRQKDSEENQRPNEAEGNISNDGKLEVVKKSDDNINLDDIPF